MTIGNQNMSYKITDRKTAFSLSFATKLIMYHLYVYVCVLCVYFSYYTFHLPSTLNRYNKRTHIKYNSICVLFLCALFVFFFRMFIKIVRTPFTISKHVRQSEKWITYWRICVRVCACVCARNISHVNWKWFAFCCYISEKKTANQTNIRVPKYYMQSNNANNVMLFNVKIISRNMICYQPESIFCLFFIVL